MLLLNINVSFILMFTTIIFLLLKRFPVSFSSFKSFEHLLRDMRQLKRDCNCPSDQSLTFLFFPTSEEHSYLFNDLKFDLTHADLNSFIQIYPDAHLIFSRNI